MFELLRLNVWLSRNLLFLRFVFFLKNLSDRFAIGWNLSGTHYCSIIKEQLGSLAASSVSLEVTMGILSPPLYPVNNFLKKSYTIFQKKRKPVKFTDFLGFCEFYPFAI